MFNIFALLKLKSNWMVFACMTDIRTKYKTTTVDNSGVFDKYIIKMEV